ncbi:unnamed protein product [Caenorhabditis auriculariae]|uniref:sphinganine-1-phosphate aldolase n=1 Tax=Caenorhabditis auriculariae TaxID=2777116 RepID=A0A8S1H774_9PELO|nr:unnamed protein product [Caenorhabditis auriculariae]
MFVKELAHDALANIRQAHSSLSERLSRYDPVLLVVAAVGGTVLYANVVRIYRRSEEPLSKRLVAYVFSKVRQLPMVKARIEKEISSAKVEIMHSIHKDDSDRIFIAEIPASGLSNEEVVALADKYNDYGKFAVEDGRVSGAVYTDRHQSHIDLLTKIYSKYAYSNPLHPDVFPGARKMEAETIRMVLNLYHGPDGSSGSLTTGGTESIIMACLAYRNRAHKLGIESPVIVAATTAHAAFDKAAQLCGMRLRHVPVDKNNRVDLRAMERAIDSEVCMLVGSAPNFPSGTIDPIPEISQLGLKYKVPVHVDACLGGFLIPFMNEAGFLLPTFDFRNQGVTSISCDTHKYACTPKGSSIVMYRSKELLHHQYFCVPEWSGGIYATPTITGSRAGANSAAAWATLLSFGRNEYVRRCKEIVSHTRKLVEKMKELPFIEVFGSSDVSVVAFRGKGINIYAVSDRMNKRGWNLNTLQNPDAIHICLTINQAHEEVVDAFIADLRLVSQEVADNADKGNKDSTAALYGMAAQIPDKSLVDELICEFLDACYASPPPKGH